MKALNPMNMMNTNRLLAHSLTVLDKLGQYQFLHLYNSYLMIESDVLKADSTRYAGADLVALTNNGLLYLFSSMKLTLAGQMVEHVNYPGQATSLLGLASYSPGYTKGCGLMQG